MTWLDDLQRRLAIAGARSLGQQFAGQVSRTIRGDSSDVWETATSEPVDASVGNAPECAWCPVCRAIRMARDSNPDMASRVAETAGGLMSAAHDVVAAVDAALSRMPGPQPASPAPPDGSAAHAEHAEPPRPASAAARHQPATPAEQAAEDGPAAGEQPPHSSNGQQA